MLTTSNRSFEYQTFCVGGLMVVRASNPILVDRHCRSRRLKDGLILPAMADDQVETFFASQRWVRLASSPVTCGATLDCGGS
jgi:hypothetical protein